MLSPFYNQRTDAYGGSLAEPRPDVDRDARGRARGGRLGLRDRLPDGGVGRRRRRGRARRGARVRAHGRPPGRPVGRAHRLDLGVVEGLGRVALLRRGLAARVDRARARGDAEADRRRRPADDAGADGRDRRVGRVGSDRRRPPEHRRPVPAREDPHRAGSPISAPASAATCASRRATSAATSAAPRTPPPARSTAAAGTRSASSARPNADREVLVVGAGPAGMECAIVLGRRGMRRVRLVDAAAEPGGITRWIPRLPGLAEWDRLRTWRLGQLAQLPNVEIETGVRMDAAGVRAAGADLVVIATGAAWAGDGRNGVTRGPIPGADAVAPARAHARAGDARGQAAARVARRSCSTATATSWARAWPSCCARHGHEVELVTSCEKVAPMCDETLEGPILRRHLHDLGIGMRAETWATRDRARRRGVRDRAGRHLRARGRRRGARHPARLGRGALPRAHRRPGPARGGLPSRRLRRAAADRRRDLGRPPARARDRLRRPGAAAAAPARAPRPGGRPARRCDSSAQWPPEHPALTYSSYLHIDELLACQEPLSDGPEHDELLFIVIHQVYELWFKVLLHELARLQDRLEIGDRGSALQAMKRILTILKTIVAQIDVLETMTPLGFSSFRGRLERASGFQSAQFRELEAVLGGRDARRARPPPARARPRPHRGGHVAPQPVGLVPDAPRPARPLDPGRGARARPVPAGRAVARRCRTSWSRCTSPIRRAPR